MGMKDLNDQTGRANMMQHATVSISQSSFVACSYKYIFWHSCEVSSSNSYLIFQTEGRVVPGRAGFAHRTPCSEILKASLGDLQIVTCYNKRLQSFSAYLHRNTRTLTIAHPQ